jgi:hypothetical protein
MSTTSASCCCGPEQVTVYSAYYLKGSGNWDPSIGFSEGGFDERLNTGINANTLNAYVAEVDTCLPCSSSDSIHGGIRVWVSEKPPWTSAAWNVVTLGAGFYDGLNCDGVLKFGAWFPKVSGFVIPYSSHLNSEHADHTLQYFHDFPNADYKNRIIGKTKRIVVFPDVNVESVDDYDGVEPYGKYGELPLDWTVVNDRGYPCGSFQTPDVALGYFRIVSYSPFSTTIKPSPAPYVIEENTIPDPINAKTGNFKPYPLYKYPEESVNQFIRRIKAEYPPISDSRGKWYPICDCFDGDALKQSATKSEYENERAGTLKRLCETWKVGVNAAHILWKPSQYIGKHDTTVIDDGGGVLSPGEHGLAECVRSNGMAGCCDMPAQTHHATTFFIPKTLKKQNPRIPLMLNMRWMCGNDNKDIRESDVLWNPHVYGQSHESALSRRKLYLRAFLAVMRFCPDGLHGYPFDGILKTDETLPGLILEPIPGLWSKSSTWKTPENINWDAYNSALSVILSPSVPEYAICNKTVEETYWTGDVVQDSSGCGFRSPPCSASPGGIFGACEGSGKITQHGKVIQLPRPEGRNVSKQYANLYYSEATDAELARIKDRSLLYFTMNDDIQPCPVDKGSKDDWSITKCGPSAVFGCCVPAEGRGAIPRGPLMHCPNFRFFYSMGDIDYRIQKISGKDNKPFMTFYWNEYGNNLSDIKYSYPSNEREFDLFGKIRGTKEGCGKWLTVVGKTEDNCPKAWWCSDAGKYLGEKTYKSGLTFGDQIYGFVPYPFYWEGTQGITVSEDGGGGGGSGFPIQRDSECLPDGGKVCWHKVIMTDPGSVDCETCGTVSTSKHLLSWGNCDCARYNTEAYVFDKSTDGPPDTDCPEKSCRFVYVGSIEETTVCQELKRIFDCSVENGCQDNTFFKCCLGVDPEDYLDCSEIDPTTPRAKCEKINEVMPQKYRNNPFIAFTGDVPRNYDVLLNKVGSAFSVRTKTATKLGFRRFRRSFADNPFVGNFYMGFSAFDFKQSLVTSLFGPNLEYGSIELQNYGQFYKNGSSYGSSSSPIDYEFIDVNEYYNPDSTSFEDISRWPQAIKIRPIRKAKVQVEEFTADSYEGAKSLFEDILKERTSLYPPQCKKNCADPWPHYCAPCGYGTSELIDYKSYWDWQYWNLRNYYELADIFTTKLNPKIKTDYYPQGIPDLSVSTVKLLVEGNGIVSTLQTEEYPLNWFWTEYRNIIKFPGTDL